MIESVLVFGDSGGVAQTLRHLPERALAGIVGAEIRAQYLAALRAIAEARRVPFLVQPRVNSPLYDKFCSSVKALGAQLILVNSYSMLIRPDVLNTPTFGAVNLHGALLPKYRGSNPLQWAIINNETETGVTLHYMDAGFDTGDIIAQAKVPILFEDTWLDVRARQMEASETLLQTQIPRLLTLSNGRSKQDEREAAHWRRRTPADGRIDWSMSTLSIYNLIRALVHPHPGAFFSDGAETRVIDEFMPFEEVAAMQKRFMARDASPAKP
ncbi:MAG TPA: methionyl-tRNA formyltransferase [Gemmatimonadaceae bacterium]|nr:methionyl-tRNA formyltransferase [Gemmatimonadaceae bacterium]